MKPHVFSVSLLFCALLIAGCGGAHAPSPLPQNEPLTESAMTTAATPAFAEYKPPANGVRAGIAFGHDNAVWFTQNNSYVGRFFNGSFSSVVVNVPQFNYVQSDTHPILTANAYGVYGGVPYFEQNGFNNQDDIYRITYTRSVSLTSGEQDSWPSNGTMQAIVTGPSAAYATGSYVVEQYPSFVCTECLYVISSTGGLANRTQQYEAGEAIAYLGGYLYIAAAENYSHGTQTGVRIYRINATTLSGFVQEAVLSAPSNIHFMTVGPDGAIWFTDNGRNSIGRFLPGHLHEYALPTANAQPVGIVRGLDGALWFTEAQVNKIGRITTTGVISEYHLPFTGGHPAGLSASPATRTLWFTDIGTGKIGRVIY